MVKRNSYFLAGAVVVALLLMTVPVTAGDPTQMAIQSGNGQSATAGTAVTTPPSVIIKDADNNPVAGISVTFAIASGGGVITGESQTTDASGIATLGSWTLGTTAGTNTLTASSGSLSPVTFTATGTAGAATQMAVNGGNGQSATVGTAVATAPSVIVKDTNNNPVNGISVIFATGSGSGSVTGGSATTNAQGIATVGSWILGTTAGTNTLTATSGTLPVVTFTATGTAVNAPSISSISPASGYNTSTITPTISGNYFSTTTVPTVLLRKNGMTNITATGVTVSGPTSIICTFPTTGKQAGLWDVIVRNPDGQYAILSNGFEIKSSTSGITLTSITPSSAVANKTISITNLAGTGFSGTPQVYLKKSGYNDIYGTFSLSSSTKLTGSFNLTNCVPNTYQVCVVKSGSDAVCGLSFVIQPMTATNGSLYITSSPSGAIVWVDNVNKGTTPVMVPVKVGSYVVKMQKTGYYDWAKRVEVTAGNETEVAATLSSAGAVTTTTTTKTPTVVITTATLPPTTVRTVPTSWAVPTAAEEESPVEIWIIVAAIVIGCIALRRK